MMLRRLGTAVAVLLAVVAGIASASLVTSGTASETLETGRDELPSGEIETGTPVKDPHGGPAWAVRIFDGESSSRCIAAARTDGEAFGPADAEGRIHDTGAVAAGSCADPDVEPLQVAVMRIADSAGDGPRTVLFGLAGAEVERVALVTEDGAKPVALDSARTFAVVSDTLAAKDSSVVEVTLSDGTSRTYRR